jgi:hypothetical protein
MKEAVTTIIRQGTISALTVVEVGTVPTTFAMVTPEEGSSRRAIRIGPNITPQGEAYFTVGDQVEYQVTTGPHGELPRAQELVKLDTDGDAVIDCSDDQPLARAP